MNQWIFPTYLRYQIWIATHHKFSLIVVKIIFFINPIQLFDYQSWHIWNEIMEMKKFFVIYVLSQSIKCLIITLSVKKRLFFKIYVCFIFLFHSPFFGLWRHKSYVIKSWKCQKIKHMKDTACTQRSRLLLVFCSWLN